MSPLQRRRWTYVGPQVFPGVASMLLVNDSIGSTRALVCYWQDEPVRIREVAQ